MAYIHQINNFDLQNDGGFYTPTISIYFNFCSFHCKGCWNKETWDRKEDLYISNEDVIKEVSGYIDSFLDEGFDTVGLSILGGDPIVVQNVSDTLNILSSLKDKYKNRLKICCWTGYVYEHLLRRATDDQMSTLKLIDRLVDGPFIISKKTDPSLGLMYGSTNQRVIEMKETLETGEIHLMK